MKETREQRHSPAAARDPVKELAQGSAVQRGEPAEGSCLMDLSWALSVSGKGMSAMLQTAESTPSSTSHTR